MSKNPIVILCSLSLFLNLLLCCCGTSQKECTIPENANKKIEKPCEVIPAEATEEVQYLFNAAGFEYNNSLKFEAVHCQPNEGYSLAENGFYQTYLTTDIGYNRITIFPQGYGIQMHYHDIDEVFNLKYGTADLYFGENLKKVSAPYTVNIPKDQIHGFRANTKNGFLLHETIDPKNFVSRAVIFVDMNKI